MSDDLGYNRPVPKRLATVAGLPLMAFLGVMLLVRVLTDNQSDANSRHSGSLNLSAVIAVLFVIAAIVLLLRHGRGMMPTVLAALWLCIWTAVAIGTRGTSTETLREGVREGSIVAFGVIVYNARGTVTVPIATRLVQLIGSAPAFLVLYQLVVHTGLDVDGNIRPNGTFAHPNSAAMFFALAAIASLWRYLDLRRRPADAFFLVLFATALVATVSIDGLITLVVMLIAFGVLHPGSLCYKLGPLAVAGVVILAFFATPLGAQRIAKESRTNISAAERDEANSTFGWRLVKWKSLLPAWERSPLFGQGLGTTVTEEAISKNKYVGNLPHNEYVRYLVETGVVGLTILLMGLALLIRSLIRKRRVPGPLDAGGLNAPTLAIVIIVGCLVNALADNTLLYSTASYAAALIVAAVLALPGVEVRHAPALQTA